MGFIRNFAEKIMEEFRIDMRKPEEADPAEGIRCAKLCFRINHTMPWLRNCSWAISVKTAV